MILFDRWEDSVEIYTEDAAIRWKANQGKDRKHIRSIYSEDALTWKVFRKLDALGALNRFVADCIGVGDDIKGVFYWHRRCNSSEIEPVIYKALGELEPYHRKYKKQSTETDIILLGERSLFMFENKLGKVKDRANGWARKKGEKGIRPEYRKHIEPLLFPRGTWPVDFIRFWQLLRNLALGKLLVKSGWWAHRGLHLVAVYNASHNRPSNKWNSTSYEEEFQAFKNCLGTVIPPDTIHGLSWQEILVWAETQPNCDFIIEKLSNHPCL